MRVLGIDTSCDETSAAVLSPDLEILGHVILSQDMHERTDLETGYAQLARILDRSEAEAA